MKRLTKENLQRLGVKKGEKDACRIIKYVVYQFIYLYNKTRHHIYMLPIIASQTAGPNGLKFVRLRCLRLNKKTFLRTLKKKKIYTGNAGPFS